MLPTPNSQQISFLRKIISRARETRVEELIVCGDFNVVMKRSLDWSAVSHRSAQELNFLAAEEELHDVWRYLHASERDYSYYSTSKKTHTTLPPRIDFFLVNSNSLPYVVSSLIDLISWSDHAPVSLTLQTRFNTTGRPPPWCLNSHIFSNTQRIFHTTPQNSCPFFFINSLPSNALSLVWCTHQVFH